jgi:hypothetical protein
MNKPLSANKFPFKIIFQIYEYSIDDYIYLYLKSNSFGEETDVFGGEPPSEYIRNLKLTSIPPFSKLKIDKLRLS